MDKLIRRFGISNSAENAAFSIVTMDSYVPNDFGTVIIRTKFELDGKTILQEVLEQAGSSYSELFQARIGELSYFLKILPLFNPQIKLDYGLQTESPSQSRQEDF